MSRRKRAKIILRLVLGLLIAALGILFVAASVMANTYDTPDRNDDALQSTGSSSITASLGSQPPLPSA